MALTRIPHREPNRLRFAAYDLEWYRDDYTVRVVGVYDAERGYRPYRTVAAFVDGELTWRNRGIVFFAHWGGRFDIQQLALTLSLGGYHVEFFLAGSGAPIVRVSKGRAYWTFADSASILRTGLAPIGKLVGLHKLECDTDAAPWAELCEYNRVDCEIVYRAILGVEEDVNSLGCEMKLTAASIAMTIFRSRFLREDVDTLASDNALFRPHYVGARVERYRERIESKPGEEWYYHDVCSSFPWSYSRKVPGNQRSRERKIPRRSPNTFVFADCDVFIPADCKIPPLPLRVDGRIFFPTGTVRTILTEWDLDLCELVGGRVETVHQAWSFNLMRGMREYAEFFYERKRAADSPFRRELNKGYLNFVYGKLGESGEKERIVINPPRTDCLHDGAHVGKDGASTCMRKLISPKGDAGVNAWIVRETVTIPHEHVPGVHAITSSSRAVISERFLEAYPMLAYGDTDSRLSTRREVDSDEMGAMKTEHGGAPIVRAHFAAPKLYELEYAPETHEERDGRCRYCGAEPRAFAGPCYEIRSKGFSRLDHDAYTALVSGGSVRSTMMRGLRGGALIPADNALTKTLRRGFECGRCGNRTLEGGQCTCGGSVARIVGARPKRATQGDFSRPWTVEELMLPYDGDERG